ncbi:nuclear transport factor 2 family protein [Caulobacter sp. 602-2]|uniref:Nuclear transport factor 2 family protein n=1 Tax=Caulobacter sp. 602-2 TaxID=2710887 RepID=A0A6G4QW01_9CAUL|nr:nuclear transport factor 2 family protein [Caulobacter sp. 602-2]NGM49721.1 nuclear transport factor 2 family protein [Caulobacter sp. 602-2]
MKTLAILLALAFSPLAAEAQTMQDQDMAARVRGLEDRAALKALVDTFSNLADTKDIDRQVLLFTQDATVDSHVAGQPTSSLKGRQQIGEAFTGFLGRFETVYHINGQQTVDIQGDRATGVAYSLVVLIGQDAGTLYRNTSGVTYHDEYVRQDGRWLIARRSSDFTWTKREEVPPPAQRP